MSATIMLHRPRPANLQQTGTGPVWVLDVTAENGTDLHIFFESREAARDWLRNAFVDAVSASDRISSDCQRGLDMIEKAVGK